MFQVSEIGKYRKKESVLLAKVGKSFVRPSGKEYKFSGYEKHGRKYLFILEYLGNRVQVSEVQYNTEIDNILLAVEREKK